MSNVFIYLFIYFLFDFLVVGFERREYKNALGDGSIYGETRARSRPFGNIH